MQFPSNPSISPDFEAFLRCKPHLAAKDACLASLMADKIATALGSIWHDEIRLLDVGSGEASLIAATCSLLQIKLERELHDPPKILVDCVEPTLEGTRLIQEADRHLASTAVRLVPQQATIRNFLWRASSRYHAVVCCHTLYYIPKFKWRRLLLELISKLDSRGVLIVNLVSRSSTIYQIWGEIVPSLDGARRMYKQWGFGYYAEDLEPVVDQIRGNWVKEVVTAQLSFSEDEVLQAIKALEEPESESALLAFLAFMYRVDGEDLRRIGKRVLLGVLEQAKRGISFQSTDKMFAFRGESI